jgi:hypothetical protein
MNNQKCLDLEDDVVQTQAKTIPSIKDKLVKTSTKPEDFKLEELTYEQRNSIQVAKTFQ